MDVPAAASAVATNPRDYGAHVAYLAALKASGASASATSLRVARTAFAELFPLSPQLWAEWVEDETKAKELSRADIKALYERAFADYQCAELWPPYLELLEEMCDDDDISDADLRAAFERGLTAAGVHVVKGAAVWKRYRHWERDALDGLREEGAGSDSDDGGGGGGGGKKNEKELKAAEARLRKIYRRQLAVPLIGNEEALAEFVELFSVGEGAEAEVRQVLEVYKSSQAMLASRLPYEKEVAELQEEAAAGGASSDENERQAKAWLAWQAYCDFEEKDGHPARAQSVLERALADNCCLLEAAWLRLSDLLGMKLGNKKAEAQAMARAVRNLPWSHALWCGYLRAAEAAATDLAAAAAAAAAAVAGGRLASAEGCVKVLMALCDAARREVAKAPAGVAAAVDKLRKSFSRAENFLDSSYPDWLEGWMAVARYRCAVEEELVAALGQPSKAKECWERLVQRFPGSAVAWMEYAAFERARRKDPAVCRAVYARGATSTRDYPEAAVEAWLQFESQAGSLTDYYVARKKTAAAMAAAATRAAAAARTAASAAAAAGAAAGNGERERERPKSKREERNGQAAAAAAADDSGRGGKQVAGSRRRGRDEAAADDSQQQQQPEEGGAEAGDVAPPPKKKSRREKKEEGERKRAAAAAAAETAGAEGAEAGTGEEPQPMEVETEAGAATAAPAAAAGGAAAAAADASQEGEAPAADEAAAKPQAPPGEPVEGGRVLYVTNLAFRAKEEDVKAALSPCGEVLDVMVVRRGGASRGMAYARMVDPEAAERAIGRAQLGMRVGNMGLKLALATRPMPDAAEIAASVASAAGGGKDPAKQHHQGASAGHPAGHPPASKPIVHPTTVFVSGLPESATEVDLERAFAACGAISCARVLRNRTTQAPKGHGLVQFEDPAAVEPALALARTQLLGSQINVEHSKYPAAKPENPSGSGGRGRDRDGGGGRGRGGRDGGDGGRGRGGRDGGRGGGHGGRGARGDNADWYGPGSHQGGGVEQEQQQQQPWQQQHQQQRPRGPMVNRRVGLGLVPRAVAKSKEEEKG